MSDVEVYWKRIASHCSIAVEFKDLHPSLQMTVVSSINQLLQVLNAVQGGQNV